MRDLSSIDFKDNVRFVVRRYLKTLGIKVPKHKAGKIQPSTEINRDGVFGVCLDKVTSVNIGEDFYCSVPKFLLDASKFLQQHLNTEGLFRKSGSIQRQKALKQKVEKGEKIENVQPHDVASLVKQFFRQLPEPLLTSHLHDSFIKTQRFEDCSDQTEAALLLCLLLPLPHLSALQFSMKFLAKVASCSEHSKMGTSNLAIVLTPNLIHNPKKEGNNVSDKQLKEQTAVIDILLKNADKVGLVSEDIYERAKLIGDEFADGLTSSGDEIDADCNIRRGKRQSRPRTRTGSLSGFVSGLGQSLSKFKNSSYKTPVHPHRRSRSVKAELLRNKVKYSVEDNTMERKEDLELENFVARNNQRMSLRLYSKRRPLDQNGSALSPASKRRAMLNDMTNEGISHPRLVSASTQMFTTPIKPLTPFKPLADMVKPGHSRVLLSSETEHVKVVDAMSYVPSPSQERYSNIAAKDFSAMSPRSDEVFDSPVDEAGARGRHREAGAQRRRVRRRHSSGATTCFSSSPRTRYQGNSKSSAAKELRQRHSSQTPIGSEGHPMEISHISVAATVEPMDTESSRDTCDADPSPARVFYTGSAVLRQSANLTPCKFHRGTPPMPATVNNQLREVLSQKI